MKILITAFSISKGLGGHTRSMYQVRELMASRGFSCEVLLIGSTAKPHEFHSCEHYINFRQLSYRSFKNSLREILAKSQADVIHAFDEYSYLLLQMVSNHRILLTRCGGPNPKRYPFAPIITLFSTENLEYFRSFSKFIDTKFFLIPQRAARFECDAKLISKLSDRILSSESDLVILRIGRISFDYQMTIRQSIGLYDHYCSKLPNKNVKLIILGAVYNQELLEDLKEESAGKQGIYFITDVEYIKEAKKVIDIADVVVGTGRGFMEGASRNKIMYVPLKGAQMPALVTNANIEECLRFNFSERVVLSEELIDTYEPQEIINQLEVHKEMIELIFEKYFNIESAGTHYELAYKQLTNTPVFSNSRSQIIRNYLYCKYLTIRYA